MSTDEDGPSVYIIRNLSTGKVYVGSSIKGRRRLRQHKRDLRVKRHANLYLQFAWNKHGKEDFEFVIHERCAADDRLIREQFWIDQLQASNPSIGYNIAHSVVSLVPAPLRSQISKEFWANLSPEERAQQSEIRKALWDDPEWRAEREQELAWKGARQRARRKADPDFNAKCLAGLAKQRNDPAAQEARAAKIRVTWADPEVRARQSARKKELAQDPEYMAKHLARAGDPASKAKLREHNKQQWEDPEIKAKRLEGLRKGRETFWSDPVRRAERMAKMHKARDEAAARRKAERNQSQLTMI